MSIKVKSAKFKNYGRISELECQFYDGVTRLVGLNGSCKTTILDGVVACIKGIALKKGGIIADRYRYIGQHGKSADIEYEFIDEKTAVTFFIKNHITKQGNNITIRSDDDQQLSESWLNSFLNVSLMSATSFSLLTGKEQAEMLGIDVSTFDNELSDLKKKATEINAHIRAFGDLEPVEPVEKIDVKALQQQETEIEASLNHQYILNRNENEERRKLHRNIEKEIEEKIALWHDECEMRINNITLAESAQSRLSELGYSGNEVKEFIKTLPEPEPEPNYQLPELILIDPEMPDNSELKTIREKINSSWENNAKYQEYHEYLKASEARKNLKKALEKNKQEQKDCIAARNEYLSSHDYGFKGLSVDDTGSLVLSVRGEDARPLKQPYFSRGEMELIMCQLHIAMNPEFRVRFIDDFEAIDEPNQKKILTSLIKNEFQVVIAEVGQKATKENTIVISEGKIEDDTNDIRPEML